MRSLVKVDPGSVSSAVSEVLTGNRPIRLPLNERPIGLNDINILAYSILEEALFELKPNELNFVAQMANAASISDKQRSWLKKIALSKLGIDIDADADDGDFTVNVESVKPREDAANDDAPPKKRGRPKKTA
jgi:hypothetical protein